MRSTCRSSPKEAAAVGALMGPICKLLKSKQNDEEWNPACRGALKSALAGRQYPQARVFAAGWSEHNRCILCLYDIVQADAAKNGTIPRSVIGDSNGTQARSWCSLERSSTCNAGLLAVASAAADGSKHEQKEDQSGHGHC